MKNLKFFLIFFLINCLNLNAEDIRIYRVVVDPGHGGAPKKSNDDKWDPITKQYLDVYNTGMRYKNYYEDVIVLQIAKKLYQILKLTETEDGWKKFENILKQFSSQEKFQRIIIKSYLSRTTNWQERGLPPEHKNINDPYRLFDYPKNNKDSTW